MTQLMVNNISTYHLNNIILNIKEINTDKGVKQCSNLNIYIFHETMGFGRESWVACKILYEDETYLIWNTILRQFYQHEQNLSENKIYIDLQFKTKLFGVLLHGWILNRTPEMSMEKLKEAFDILRENGYESTNFEMSAQWNLSELHFNNCWR